MYLRWLLILGAMWALGGLVSGCGGVGKNGQSAESSLSTVPRRHPFTAETTRTTHAPPLGDEDDDESAHGRVGTNANDNDADFDNDRRRDHSYFDSDDGAVRRFGRAATAGERRAIATIVHRYVADSVAANGADACSILEPAFAATIVKTYGRGSAGPPYLRSAGTCGAVLSLLFDRNRLLFSTPAQIVRIRVGPSEARALLISPHAPAGYLSLRRQAHTWQITTLLATAFG